MAGITMNDLQARDSVHPIRVSSASQDKSATDISKMEEENGGLFRKATKTDNKKLGIIMCVVLTVLLIILMIVYFSIDDGPQTIEIIQEDEDDSDLFTVTETTTADNEDEEVVYNAYNLEKPTFFPGDTDKCKQ